MFDTFPQLLKHCGQVGLKLNNRFAEVCDFRSLVPEEEFKQMLEIGNIVNCGPLHLRAVLDQDSSGRVLENDIRLRVAAAKFFCDLFIKIIVLVLGLLIAEWHAQVMH